MIENSKKLPARLFAAVVLSLAAACSVSASGQIPCADDSSCPADYPVCSSGKCIAGAVPNATSVAIVAVAGHLPTDMVRGTVNVVVSARASTGIASVTLGSGSKTYQPGTTSAPPVYQFSVPTTDFADGVVPLAATLVSGDGKSTTSATYSLNVDNTPPVITGLTAGSSPVLSQVVASSGTVLHIDLKVNETATLEATATTGTQVFPMGEVDSGTAGVRRLQFAVGSTTPTGAYKVSITVTDVAGNVTVYSDSTPTPLHFNVTVPLNVTMSVTGHLDSSSNKIKINGIPAATAGDSVKAAITLPSGVSFGSGWPKYRVIKPDATCSPSCTGSFAANLDGSGTFVVATGEQEGVFTFHADIQDSAGSAATIEQPFLVATTPPHVVSGTAGIALSTNYLGPNLTALSFDFSTDATPATFTVTVNGHNATAGVPVGNHYFYTYTLQSADLPGTASAVSRTVSVQVGDVLGNRSTSTKTLTVDNLAPTITAAPVSNTAVAGNAATVNLSFTVTDTGAVGGNPTVTVAPGAGVTTHPAALVSRTDHVGSSDFVYQYVVNGADLEQGASVSVDTKDAALNDFTQTFTNVFTIDRTAPVASAAAVGNANPITVPYQFFNAGSTVFAKVTALDCNLASVAATVGYVSTGAGNPPVNSPMTSVSAGTSNCGTGGVFVFSRAVAADEPNGASTITFTATDLAGNVGSLTATYQVNNVPPVVDQTASIFAPTTSFDGTATLTLAVSEKLKTLNLKLRNLTSGHDYTSGDTTGGYAPVFALDGTTPLPCDPCKINITGLKQSGHKDDWKFVISSAADAVDQFGNQIAGPFPIVSTNKITIDGTAASLALTSQLVSPLFLRSTVANPGTVTFTGTSTRPLANVTMNTPINLSAASGGGNSADTPSCSFLGSNVNCTISTSANEGSRVAVGGNITDLNSNNASYTAPSFYTVDNTAPAFGSVTLSGGFVVGGARTFSAQSAFGAVDLAIPVTDCDTSVVPSVTAVDGNGSVVTFTAGQSASPATTTSGTMGCASSETFYFNHTVVADHQGVTQITILATDRAGNSTSTSTNYLVDTAAPAVAGVPFWSKTIGHDGGSGTTLQFTAATSEPVSVSINGTATVGNHTADTIRFTDGTNTYFNAVTTNGVTPSITLASSSPCTLCTFTVTGLTKAASSIVFTPQLKLADQVGNTSSLLTQTGITYTNDTVIPDFAAGIVVTPAVVGANTVNASRGVVTVTGTASKPIKSVAFSTNDGAETATPICSIDPTTQLKITCTLTLADTSTSAQKTVAVTVNPTDFAGNDKTGGTAAHYTNNYVLDNVALQTSPGAATPSVVANGQTVTISGTATKADTSKAAISLTNATVVVDSGLNGGTGTGSCTFSGAAYNCLVNVTTSSTSGRITNGAQITLTDSAGNQVTTGDVNYSVDNRAPVAGTLTATPGTVVTTANSPVTLAWGAATLGANCSAATPCTITSSSSADAGHIINITDNSAHSPTGYTTGTVFGGGSPCPAVNCIPNPTKSTTYTLTVFGANGTTATSTASVTVAPTIGTFTTTQPIVTTSGSNNVTFTIVVNGVDCTQTSACAITGTDSTTILLAGKGAFSANQYTLSTQQAIAPLGGVTYTLTATDTNSVAVTKTTFVDVVPAPSFTGTLSTPTLTGGAGVTQLTFTMPTMNGAATATFKDNSSTAVQSPAGATLTSTQILAASGTPLNIKAPTTSASGTTPQTFTYTLALANSATAPAPATTTANFIAYPLPTVGTNMAAGAGMPTVIAGGTDGTYTLTLPTFGAISATTGTLALVDPNNSNAPVINDATGLAFTSSDLFTAGTGGAVTARLPATVASSHSTLGFQLVARNLASDAVNVNSNTVSLTVVPVTPANLAVVRFGASATTLPNGKVLIAGGSASLDVNGDCQAGTPVKSADIYDPSTGSVTATTNTMTVARCQHTAVLVGTSVYFIGGAPTTLVADVFDTTANGGVGAFTQTSLPTALVAARTRHTSTNVAGVIFSIGGVTPATTTALTSIETWTPPAGTPATYTGTNSSLSVARASHTATLLTGFAPLSIVILGGSGDNTAEAFNTLKTSGQNNAVSAITDNNLIVRKFHSAVQLSGGTILVAGGVDGAGASVTSAQIFDPNQGFAGHFWGPAVAMVGAHVRFPMISYGTNKAALFGGTGSTFDFVELFDAAATPNFSAYKTLSSSRNAAAAASVTSKFPGANKEVWVVAGGAVGTAGAVETVVGP